MGVERILAALPFLVLALAGCQERKKSGPAHSKATPEAAIDGGTLRCSDVLTAGDVQDACGVAVTLANSESDLDDIGVERTCSRRFVTAHAESLSFLITRFEDARTARSVFEETTAAMAEKIEGLGDGARRYTRTRAGDDTVLNVELVKGRLDVLLFTARVPLGGRVIAPVCSFEQLDNLAHALAARLP